MTLNRLTMSGCPTECKALLELVGAPAGGEGVLKTGAGCRHLFNDHRAAHRCTEQHTSAFCFDGVSAANGGFASQAGRALVSSIDRCVGSKEDPSRGLRAKANNRVLGTRETFCLFFCPTLPLCW